MRGFIWVSVIVIGIEAFAKIICLATGYFPPRNKGATVFDVVLGIGMIVWGAILLSA